MINRIILSAVGLLALFSCSTKEDRTSPRGDDGFNSLAIAVATFPMKTRAVDDAKTDGMTIRSMAIKVYDANGDEIAVSGLDAIGGDVLANIIAPLGTGNGQLALDDPARRIAKDINADAAKVEVRGYNSTVPPVWRSKADLDVTPINNLQLADMPFVEIPFISISEDGKDDIAKERTRSENLIWTAQAEIKPYFARFEVVGVPVEKNDAATISLKAIYINNIAVAKGAAPTMYKGNGAIWEKDADNKIIGSAGDMEAAYRAAFTGMYNESLDGYTGKADAYTLWGQTGMLHIILKVNVTPKNGNPAYDGFITLRQITGASAIEIGKIYRLDLNSLKIDYVKDVDPQPYEEDAEIKLSVTIRDWNEIKYNPDL